MREFMTWSELVIETRKLLGITRSEFAAILGITTAILADWEYRGVIPHAAYQDMVLRLYNNSDAAKEEISRRKQQYTSSFRPDHGDSKKDFLKGAIVGGATVGAIALLLKILGSKDED